MIYMEETYRVINLVMNTIVSIIFAVLIVTASRAKERTRSINKSYIPLMAAALGSTLADLIGWITNGSDALSGITFTANALFYICNFLALAISAKYLVEYLEYKTDAPRRLMWLIDGGCAIGIGIVAANFFYPILFYVNEAGVYTRLDSIFFGATQLIGLMSMAICAAVVIMYRKTFAKGEFARFLVGYNVLPIAALVIQAIVYGATFVNASVAAFGLLMYINSQRELEKIIEDSRLSLKESRKSEMQSRIFERFLMGFMTPIRELTEYNPDKAFDAINLLLEYKKYSQIDDESYALIPFEKELKQAKSFTELAKVCYGIHFEFVFNAKFTDFEVPPMTIIPLLDNAVVHGLSETEEGEIVITTEETPEGALIEITDNGIGCDPGRVKAMKKSIFTLKERIRLLCGGDLKVISKPGNGTAVKITVKRD
ncbi:MAG: hypothetical protein LBL87_05170 [Ruminococcus sp.]|jgi:glucose-6-phosphate-specific signal transduction histidine kinase|nr:hypothetical protein [Ruminococcus sp.]